jgi:hypothetical protein
MSKKLLAIIFLIVVAAGAGVWYYVNHLQRTPIEKILASPQKFEGKEVTIEGLVTDRTSFFVVLKFFKLKDKTGEIIVLTKQGLPHVKSTVSVRGKIDEAFPVGDQKFLVFVAEAIEEKGGK